MAQLRKIEEYIQRLGDDKEPGWVRGYTTRDNHLSGALREMGDEIMGDPDVNLDDIEGNIRSLLEEAAETLDDAHQNWLSLQLAARDVCGDINAMRSNVKPLGAGHWFGGFSKSQEIGEYVVETYIEWPNIDISEKQLAAVLRGEEYTL